MKFHYVLSRSLCSSGYGLKRGDKFMFRLSLMLQLPRLWFIDAGHSVKGKWEGNVWRTERCSCTCGITSFEPMKYLILEHYGTFTWPSTPLKWWNWKLERIMDWTNVILLPVTFRMNDRAQAPNMPVERMSWWHIMSDFGWKKAISLSKHWPPKGIQSPYLF